MKEQQPKIASSQTRMLISHGHEYADTPRMREMIKRANEIRATLPAVPDGYTRLWRGNRPSEVGKNPSYTSSLEGIALPFLDGYGGELSYIDISNTDLGKYLQSGAGARNAEFILPAETVKKVKIVGMSNQKAEELKNQSKPKLEENVRFDSPV